MTTTKLVGSIVKFGARRTAGGVKEKTLVFEVHGSIEALDFLMDKPLGLTIEVLPEIAGSKGSDPHA